ncbi:hypothetical protein ACE2AJ_09530 [Aquihabitans daechungensis]|uniref:hypothetical protein n=1 Tax=Aquihabitans daechungensis TaxID=1052257 RepID=UPI003BA2B953
MPSFTIVFAVCVGEDIVFSRSNRGAAEEKTLPVDAVAPLGVLVSVTVTSTWNANPWPAAAEIRMIGSKLTAGPLAVPTVQMRTLRCELSTPPGHGGLAPFT